MLTNNWCLANWATVVCQKEGAIHTLDQPVFILLSLTVFRVATRRGPAGGEGLCAGEARAGGNVCRESREGQPLGVGLRVAGHGAPERPFSSSLLLSSLELIDTSL